ncbi:MAG: ribosome silencing factor [Verrucomicrobia bacterium CG_4_10_14_3_um_filter_43_23]|nr:MAG: ribosome silencing factor [Verrucomicrobia bacterium CG22_combo_CG10-13_8_21_14_all_43_17]PIX57848.1 MAG: ribosome silencing factor [Verrucomicrobia bacterium CG_4_10_14_3_um_filter_43_23]PIY63053.1 MAG: ribosome silencing factor [Verrucomicrobia bacterium CG_4_10_14_0_8_um_filter_43_34]PJA43699.1 MAG: ribosome silencing factor [Verrucomicrobia bacterium CG_4_9_14_3_um_filter_43_20]
MEDNNSVVMGILRECYNALDDKKAMDIKILKLVGKSSITDYFIIASGNSEPHLRALRSTISDTLSKLKLKNIRIDYEPDSGWAVIDGFDFMVHIFSPDMRSNYNLDKLWQDAEVIDLSK